MWLLLQMNAFCGRCGAATAAIEAGAKRQCVAEPRHRVYPRTDPVVGFLCPTLRRPTLTQQVRITSASQRLLGSKALTPWLHLLMLVCPSAALATALQHCAASPAPFVVH